MVWRPSLPAAGAYTVSVWLPDGGVNNDRSSSVKYRVHHSGQVSEFIIDQTVTGGYWRTLGRGPLAFAGTGDEFVELRVADVAAPSNNAPLYIQADAVRIATPPPPLSVAPVVGVNEGRNYLELAWPLINGAEGYVVSREIDGQLTEVADQTIGSHLDLDLDIDASVRYAVCAYNGGGLGPATVIDTSLTPGPPLQAVQGLVLADENGRPRLDWQPSRDARGYSIERATRSGGQFTAIAQVATPGFTDTGAAGPAYYRVRSVNAHGASALSSWQVNWFAVAPRPSVAVTVSSRCITSKSLLAVQVLNTDSVTADVKIVSDYGTKLLLSVAPGKYAVHTFTTRQNQMPAGSVAVTATASAGGVALSNTVTAAYSARSCT